MAAYLVSPYRDSRKAAGESGKRSEPRLRAPPNAEPKMLSRDSVPIKRECASVAALDKPLRLAIVADEAPCAIASCAGFGFSAGRSLSPGA